MVTLTQTEYAGALSVIGNAPVMLRNGAFNENIIVVNNLVTLFNVPTDACASPITYLSPT